MKRELLARSSDKEVAGGASPRRRLDRLLRLLHPRVARARRLLLSLSRWAVLLSSMCSSVRFARWCSTPLTDWNAASQGG